MDKERERIQEDLRGLLEGDVYCDDLFVQMYASDASIYEIRPMGVVRPRSVADVVACVEYAAENNIPIHARGSGTGVAGESLGAGLMVDFSTHMRRVLEINEDTVRFQPGIVLAQLNDHLKRHDRLFGPDPATRRVTTMGSVLAVDGGGSHWPAYGSARDHVVKLQVVMADGSILEAERIPLESETEPPSRRNELARRVSDLIRRESAVIADHRPKTAVNRSGYHVYDIVSDGHIDLARLLVGSEGTLGLITEATVRTPPRPKQRGVALLYFDRLESAAQGALLASGMGVSACDLMDRRLLSISREIDERFDLLVPNEAEAMVLVEVYGDDVSDVRDQLNQLVSRIQRRKRLAFDSQIALDTEDRNLFWHLVRRVIPRLYRLKGSIRPLPFVEDIAVPPKLLPDFLIRMQNVFKEHQVTATFFSHVAQGQIHVRPFLNLADSEDVRRMQDLATQLYEQVLDVGGTISGEHGDGLSRTWFVQRQHGPLYEVFRGVKRIFDPQNILNPGKIVADAPQPLTKNLRPVVAPNTGVADPGLEEGETVAGGVSMKISLQLIWEGQSIENTARSCNGCGRCRTEWSIERMCPIFRIAPREEASPRAKGNLMRAVLTGSLEQDAFATDALKSIADLCVNCHQCRLECPAEVDIPKLMVECKAQYVATNGLKPSEWLLARPDILAAYGSSLLSFSNWAIGNRPMRWLLEKFAGIAQGRKLPRLAVRNFIRVAHRRKLCRPTRSTGIKVLYFADVYATWYDVQLAESLVAVLEHNGIEVYVPPRPLHSGMAAVSAGATDAAKRLAEGNVKLLADAVRQGYHIVTTEPSAALCLTHEYPNLLDDDDVRLVARNTSEACNYLWKLHQHGELKLDFSPIDAVLGYHQPCHQRALKVGSPGRNLVRLIPGLAVRLMDHGCSGMAGNYGLKRRNYRNSLRVGWNLISALRDPAIQCGVTECSACKIQMEQGTTKPTLHPLKLLAHAYGLMPDVARLLSARGEELIVT
ncbi:MAG: anaerobic glycerol-3-phosphate dehydrogenase subunit C [Pirellulaceae bacterium]|jgi:FAD/FMN-containing dehydrogenase/Fe-S oxidoreductase|nr:anaerobic glycerol-3-phosphate dehydrogenase subunit C [Pirellulaceae bacterium]MDP6553769.1 anaerobic glycerol-3-phosphate dehydrogenase subunit C [Pirellulaceae bacterium]